MKCEFYGLCLIVNNVDFENFSRRGGFDVDVKKFDELFIKFQYKVKMVRNQILKQFKEILIQFVRLNDYGMVDFVIVCFFSYGLEG